MSDKTSLVVVDVDGVILNFTKGFEEWWNIEKRYDLKTGHTVPKNPSDWHFEYDGEKKFIYSKLKQYMDTKPMLELFDESAPESLTRLYKYFKVIIVTAYPHKDSRIVNLEKVGIRKGYEYDEIYTTHRKCKVTEICEITKKYGDNVAFILEDCPDHVLELADRGFTVYAPKHWNYLVNTFEEYDCTHTEYSGQLIDYKQMSDVVDIELKRQLRKSATDSSPKGTPLSKSLICSSGSLLSDKDNINIS